MAEYSQAPEVETIARNLIRDVEMHKSLDGVRIDFIFRDKAAKSKGRTVLAKARKVSGINAYLANASAGVVDDAANDDMFVIEVAQDAWERLDPGQRRALVDHELCHCKVDLDDDGEPKLSIRGHDLEEFGCIIERHGLWSSNVANFGSQVAEQLALAVEEVTSFVESLGNDEDGDA